MKINEIAQQVGITIDDKVLSSRIMHCTKDNFNKFADLLVENCITICEEIGTKQDGQYCADKIKESFSEDSN